MTNQEIITAAGDLTAIYCMAAQSIILEKKEVQKNDCAGTLPDNLSQTKPKPEPASKLTQDVDTATETTNVDNSTSSMVTKEEEITEKKRRGNYRTKAKAGKIDKMPSYLPVITLKDYRSALTINNDSSAHLLLLPVNSKLEYEDKILYLNGQIASYDEVSKLSTDDGIAKINFPLLSELFGVILYKFENDSKNECKDEEFTVYYPDIAGRFRKSKSKKKKTDGNVSNDNGQEDEEVKNSDWKSESASILNDNMALFGRMAGVINTGTPNQLILPVLTDYGYDPASNTFHFRSPYMTKLISVIHKARIKKIKMANLRQLPAIHSSLTKQLHRKEIRRLLRLYL